MSNIKWSKKQEHFDWMQKCLTCWKMCEEFMTWCIENGQYVSSLNACRDTTEMCSQCIKFEAQSSPFFKQLCEVCADICEKFTFQMKKLEGEDEIFLATVKSCIIFSKACRKVVQKQNGEVGKSKTNLIPKKGNKI